MIDQATTQAVTNAITTSAAAAGQDRAALIAGIQQLTVVVAQLVQLGGHVTTGGMAAHVLEWAKGKPIVANIWSQLSARAKVIWAALLAGLPAAGIVLTFQHTAPGDYVLGVHNLTSISLGALAWSFLQNWFAQQAYYQAILKPRPVSGAPAQAGVGAMPAAPVEVHINP